MSSSNGLGWEDVSHRSYRYAGLDVPIPPMDHFMIVRYRSGNTPMERSMHGQRTKAVCGPGDFSLLTHAEHSHWYWTECIDVSHTYLSENLMCRVASDVLERTVAEVRLHDLLRSQDPVVTGIVDAITVEALHKGLGGSLYVEALALQLAVHLLRDYASVTYRDSVVGGAISPSRLRRLQEFIEAHMHEGISIEQMAGVVGLGVWTFTKHFKATTGRAPHEFVLDCRVERARRLLAQGLTAIKEVASYCGFADQAHMTRVFRARLGTTPSRVKKGN
ncbi:helix-turn-helix domain-containing protein [Comamonas composti]|uniref:helix-turn-helix domain-containing protein n=1 Tax=Comamonas composti TaxID=408558 RepID=UPI001B7FDEAC|nr:AraC family transcriptional regulator [Comamonas composti]